MAPLDVEHQLRQHGSALRRLAGELLHDAADADDAMQQVWVAALREPPAESVAVGGWLRTVLVHASSRLRRGAARRRRHEANGLPAPAAEDPANVLAREETVQRLLTAVLALEPPFREAIWQRYFEGKAPREIATVSGVGIATVKSRLQRGLAKLRDDLGEQLGDGSEGDWRSALGMAFGFGVQSLGPAANSVMQGAAVVGTSTKVAAVAAVCIAVAICWPRGATVQPDVMAVGVGAATVAAAAPSPEPTAVVTTLERDVVAAPNAAPTAPAELPVLRHGRVVDADTGQALPAVTVIVGHSMGLLPAATDPRVLTGDDGRFEVACDANRTQRIYLSHFERLMIYVDTDRLAPGQSEDLGDLPLRRGHRLSGRLVDAQGAPAPAGIVVQATFGSAWGSTWRQSGRSEGTTQVDGGFLLDPPVANGTIHFDLARGEFELVAPEHVELGERDAAEITLVVRPRRQIDGVVVDQQGQPVANVGLSLLPGTVDVRTTAQGTFRLLKFWKNDRSTASVVVSDAPDHAPMPPIDVPWGTRDLRIVLTKGASLPIEVVDADGAAVLEYGVVLLRSGIRDEEQGKVLLRGHHDGGRLSVGPVAPGQTSLRVVPVDASCMPSEAQLIVNLEPMRIVLRKRVPCAVEVVSNRRPVAEAVVELVFDGGKLQRSYPGRAPLQLPWVNDPHHDEKASGWDPERIAIAHTAADGIARLLRDPVVAGRTLLVHVEGQPVLFVGDPVFPADNSALRVTLPEFGEVTGRVALRNQLRHDVLVEFRSGDQREWTSPQPDGAFRSPLLPAGHCEVTLSLRVGTNSGTLPGSRREVDVHDGAPATVDFDLDAFPLATVHGRVLGSRGDRPGLSVDLLRLDAAGAPTVLGNAMVGDDGTFHAEGLLPGTYRAALRAATESPALVPGLQAETFPLEPGATHDLVVPAPRRLVVHLRRPDGSVVHGEQVIARCAGAQWPAFTMFMAAVDEQIVLDPAPLLPVEFKNHAANSPWSEPIVMPADGAAVEVTVVLPDTPR